MLSTEMKEAIMRADLLPLATSSLAGIPNVVPVKYVKVVGDNQLWITDNYLHKTLANLQENPIAALYVLSAAPKLCVQVKGEVTLHTAGEDYETMKAQVRAEKPDIPARSLLVLTIREIYQCLPSDGPGRRIWP